MGDIACPIPEIRALSKSELTALNGVTAGTVTASKALIVDSSKNLTGLGTVGCGAITSGGIVAATGFTIGGVAIVEAELAAADGVVLGTGAASKFLSCDASGNATTPGTFGVTGILTAGGITVGAAVLIESELEMIDGITAGAVLASKAVVVDASKNIATLGTVGCGAITSTGTSSFGPVGCGIITGTGTITAVGSFIIGLADMSESDLEQLDGITAGTAAASKALVLDASTNIAGVGTVGCSTVTIGTAATGLVFGGAYTTSALVAGTSGAPIALAAHDDHIFDIYSTCASVDAANSVRPIHMTSTMTGVGGVGGRAEFHMYTNVALGDWSNALKGFAEYGAAGATTGLGSGICAELQLSAGTTTGNYAPLEVELLAPTGASLGTRTAMMYFGVTGVDKAAVDTGGNLFSLDGLTVASGKMFQANTAAAATHALRCNIGGTSYYVMLTSIGA